MPFASMVLMANMPGFHPGAQSSNLCTRTVILTNGKKTKYTFN